MKIILAVSGGIAAYKACEIARLLKDHEVRVVMTKGALKFITPLSFQAITGNRVHTDLLDVDAEAAMGHIELARWAEKILIAPASANCIARLARGMADDLLTTLCLATTAPIIIAPAMNQQMWKNRLTQENIITLKEHDFSVIDPDEGEQACGEVGPGRLPDPNYIVEKLLK